MLTGLPPQRVTARNTSAHSANQIHDDAEARRLGFRGGLVPGVTVCAYTTRAVPAALGPEWLARGWASVRFVLGADVLEARFRERPRAEWLRALGAHDVPCAPVQSLEAFVREPAAGGPPLLRRYAPPEVGPLELMWPPLDFSATPVGDPGPPPTLGQHTEEVLAGLGYDEAAIAGRRRGVVAGGAGG